MLHSPPPPLITSYQSKGDMSSMCVCERERDKRDRRHRVHVYFDLGYQRIDIVKVAVEVDELLSIF